MPLAGFALYESGIEIYVASTGTTPTLAGDVMHLALESRAFVVAPCHFQQRRPSGGFPLREAFGGRGGRPRRERDPRPGRGLPRDGSTTRRGSSTRSSTRRGSHEERQRFRPGRPLPPPGRPQAPGPARPRRDAGRPRSPRTDFPVLEEVVYLNTGSIGLEPVRCRKPARSRQADRRLAGPASTTRSRSGSATPRARGTPPRPALTTWRS